MPESEPTLHTVMRALDRVSDKQDNHTVMFEKLDTDFNGPAGQPEKGVPIRVDRLEQRQKLVWGALITGVAALGKGFWSMISGN